MSKKIYISRSNHISERDTEELAQMCKDIFKTSYNNVSWWNRGTKYSPTKSIHCDIFILLVENILDGLHIGKGSYGELQQSLSYGKTVMLAYRRVCDGTIQLYDHGGSTVVSSSSMTKYAKVQLGSNITEQIRRSYQNKYEAIIPKSPPQPTVNVTVNVNVGSPLRATRLSQIPGWTRIKIKKR